MVLFVEVPFLEAESSGTKLNMIKKKISITRHKYKQWQLEQAFIC